jgi:hypothetical protein
MPIVLAVIAGVGVGETVKLLLKLGWWTLTARKGEHQRIAR